MENQQTIEIARQAFRRIMERFPGLTFQYDNSAPVELCIHLPVQSGLKFPVNLNLQNQDELHFSVENFWLKWYPCTDPSIVEAYINAVSGFLAGHYRILEHYRGRKCIQAELQEPRGDGLWTTIGRTVHWRLTLPVKKYLKEIRNA